MEKLIDMHTHTCYSDGTDTPKELIDKATKNNIGVISITDHDTILGVQSLKKGNINPNITIIPGFEMTGSIDKGQLHILGYNIDINNKKFNEKMIMLRELSIIKTKRLVNYIASEYNVVFNDEDLNAMYNSVGNIGRPQIARLCIKYGYVTTAQEAFNKYLVEGYNKVQNKQLEIPAKDCIGTICNASGIPVLAHPYSLKKDLTELRDYIKELMNYGLQGIEVYHSKHSDSYAQELLKICKDYNLLISGGSDYHGETIKPDVKLGIGKDNIRIKRLSLVDKIMNK